MEQVDFEYVDEDGNSIYLKHAYNGAGEKEWSRDKKFEVLKFLIKEGEKNGFDVNAILEKASITGTCFTYYDDKNIIKYLLDRGMKINSIGTDMMIPGFKFPDLAVQMMSKGKVHDKSVLS